MHSDDPQQPELLRVCRIGRAQGLKGEVTVQIFTDEPEYRFAPGAVLYTKDGEGEYVVENSRTFKNRWIIKFEGIDNRDQSEAANGIVLYGEADDPEDIGRVIGRSGRTANAIRAVVQALSDHKVRVDIMDVRR